MDISIEESEFYCDSKVYLQKLEEACQEINFLNRSKYLQEYLKKDKQKSECSLKVCDLNENFNIFDLVMCDELDIHVRVAKKEDMHAVFQCVKQLAKIHGGNIPLQATEEDFINGAFPNEAVKPVFYCIVLEIERKNKGENQNIGEKEEKNENTDFFFIEEDEEEAAGEKSVGKNKQFINRKDLINKFLEQEENKSKQNNTSSSKILVGYAFIYPYFSTLKGRSMHLEDIYINKYFRIGGGFGKFLIKSVIYFCSKKMKMKSMSLDVQDGIEARDFYLKIGADGEGIFNIFKLSKKQMQEHCFN